jgi:hypothetical protein
LDHGFAVGDAQRFVQVLGQLGYAGLAVAMLPHPGGGAVEAMGLVPLLIVDQRFLSQLANG